MILTPRLKKMKKEDEQELEDRSMLAIPAEYAENADASDLDYWQIITPDDFNAISTKNGQVKLTWSGILSKLPKGVKYYCYELDSSTGSAWQVGKATTKKSLTLKNVKEGYHTYFVRAEAVNRKTTGERYGYRSAYSSEWVNNDTLWKKAPSLKIWQSYNEEVTLRWTPKDEPDEYALTITRGKGKKAIKETVWLNSDDTEYVDYDAIVGKNTYSLRPYKDGKAGKAVKKSVSVQQDAWKAAPRILKVEQVDYNICRVTFEVASPADGYLITGGKKKADVDALALDDADGGAYSCDIVVPSSGKRKFTVQPYNLNEKGKKVKGKKSATYKLTLRKNALTLPAALKAAGGTNSVTISWECPNEMDWCYHIYLWNSNETHEQTVSYTERSCTFTGI